MTPLDLTRKNTEYRYTKVSQLKENDNNIEQREFTMGEEKRRHVRIEVPMPVEVTHPEQGTVELITADLCESGVFLKADPAQCPAVGEEVTLKVKGGVLGGGEEPPLVKARVVRVTAEGMGVEFL